MKCPACGVDVAEQAAFCHKCGENLSGEDRSGGKPSGGGAAKDKPRGPASPSDFARQMASSRTDDDDDDVERVLWKGGYSANGMIGSWILAVLATVVLVAVAVLLIPSGVFWFVPLGAILILWIALGGCMMLRKMGVSYELTTQRFLHRAGVLSRKTDRIEVIDMDDVSFQQGLLQRMVGVGSIHIVSSDRSHPELHLQGIADVENVAELIDETRRAERRRRGIHIEAI